MYYDSYIAVMYFNIYTGNKKCNALLLFICPSLSYSLLLLKKTVVYSCDKNQNDKLGHKYVFKSKNNVMHVPTSKIYRLPFIHGEKPKADNTCTRPD